MGFRRRCVEEIEGFGGVSPMCAMGHVCRCGRVVLCVCEGGNVVRVVLVGKAGRGRVWL